MSADDVLKQIDVETIASDTLEFIRVTSETGTESAGCGFLADLWRWGDQSPEPTVSEVTVATSTRR